MSLFQRDRVNESDKVVACACGSQHYFALRKVHTGVVRGGKFVDIDAGLEAECIACGAHFAVTDQGKKPIHNAQQQPDYQNSTAQPEKPRTRVTQWEPKQRRVV